MKKLRMIIAALLAVLALSSWQALPLEDAYEDEKYSGMVILQIAGMSDDVHAKMQEAVSGDPDISVEYVCVESGITVINFSNSSMAEKGDNEMMVRRRFKGCASPGSITTIFVDVRVQEGTSKC